MKIKLRLFANFREKCGQEKIEIEMDGDSTVEELLKKVSSKNPQLKDIIFNNGEVTEYVNILLNEENIENLDGIKTPLSNGDEVAMFPPVSGG